MNSCSYNPNIAIHPGKTLEEMLIALKMSQVDLATRTGLTPKTINEIIQGKNPITPDTAIKLSDVFGVSAEFWNNLQKNYEHTELRLKEEAKLQKELAFLKNFSCYKELVQWGYVEDTRNKAERVKALLMFFKVSSLEFVSRVHPVAFRKSKNKSLSNESLAAWLRCGEIVADKINTKPFNRDHIMDSIDSLRVLSKVDPRVFQSRIVSICAEAGIAVAFVPHFTNTFVCGATRWINPDKALIQLSVRGGRDDIFWFTFFHELGHLLKHGKRDQFVEFEKRSERELQDKEEVADEFSQNTLINKLEYAKFIKQNEFTDAAIKEFANAINIAPSIIAGRLSHDFKDWTSWTHLRKHLRFVHN